MANAGLTSRAGYDYECRRHDIDDQAGQCWPHLAYDITELTMKCKLTSNAGVTSLTNKAGNVGLT